MTAYVTVSGPMFDGRAQAALSRGLLEARHDVASAGVKLTQANYLGSIRKNTGKHIASITHIDGSRVMESRSGHRTYTMPVVVEDPKTDTVVTTTNATYGPWLEGTGSRNQTTRFKGYHGFRRGAQQLSRVAQSIATHTLQPYVQEMN